MSLGDGLFCRACGALVPDGRREPAYATPVCFECVPPPHDWREHRIGTATVIACANCGRVRNDTSDSRQCPGRVRVVPR